MTTQIQRRRGTTAQHSTFTGAVGEVTVDTDKEVLVVHDGAQVGGYPQMRENGSNSALSLGSAATPSLKFTGDTNTGIYSPGADQVAISTNGTGRLFVANNGRVGVGAANPGTTLHTIGDGRFEASDGSTIDLSPASDTNTFQINRTNARLLFNGTGTAKILKLGASPGNLQIECSNSNIEFLAGGSERLRITSAGLVGVGTSSPNQSFVNAGPRAYLSGAGAVYALGLGHNLTRTAADQVYFLGATDSATPDLVFSSNSGSEKMRLDSSGRLGIGTTSPSRPLHLSASSGNVFQTITCASAQSAGLLFGQTGGSDAIGQVIQDLNTGDLQITANATERLRFTGPGATIFRTNAAEAARITSSGQLLVGTSTSTGAPSSGAVIQLADQFSVRAASGGGVTNRVASTASGTTLNCVIDVPISSNIFSSFIGTLYICQQLTNSAKSFLAEYRVKIWNSGAITVFTLVDSVDASAPNNAALTFAYSNSNRQITVTSTWTTATASTLICTLVGAGANA